MAFFSLAQGGGGGQRKQQKSIDQRALEIGYEGIKSLWSLAMKNYLVTGGLLSLVESYNNEYYHIVISCLLSVDSDLPHSLPWWQLWHIKPMSLQVKSLLARQLFSKQLECGAAHEYSVVFNTLKLVQFSSLLAQN